MISRGEWMSRVKGSSGKLKDLGNHFVCALQLMP